MESLLTASRLPVTDHLPDVVPEARVWKFFELSAQRLNMPQIGLLSGTRVSITDLGPFGRALQNRLTLHDCLRLYIEQVNQHSSYAHFWTESEASGVWSCRRGIDLIDCGREIVEQFTIQLMIRLVQLAAGPQWQPSRMRVQHTESRVYREWSDWDPVDIRPQQSVTAIWIPQTLQVFPLRRKCSTPLLQSSRSWLTSNLARTVSLEEATAAPGHSRRTVQRELSRAGMTWSTLVDQVRVDRAVRLLRTTDDRMIDIAHQPGYTDPSNFSRAFGQWTGLSPSRWRRLHRATRRQRRE